MGLLTWIVGRLLAGSLVARIITAVIGSVLLAVAVSGGTPCQRGALPGAFAVRK